MYRCKRGSYRGNQNGDENGDAVTGLTYCGLSEGCSFPLLVASFTKSIQYQHTSYSNRCEGT